MLGSVSCCGVLLACRPRAGVRRRGGRAGRGAMHTCGRPAPAYAPAAPWLSFSRILAFPLILLAAAEGPSSAAGRLVGADKGQAKGAGRSCCWCWCCWCCWC